ncbi:hypothetical protein QAD02_023713 [Eretmocerus hayati]|uniref:Uncharacterized protein n=1 Tax=Eretmocerus hayati TaxID=131215 RepID=A0ACC2PXR8_9HYME|nr:hypothetical protein QAD02_023713 [Eretmocerus hayati]
MPKRPLEELDYNDLMKKKQQLDELLIQKKQQQDERELSGDESSEHDLELMTSDSENEEIDLVGFNADEEGLDSQYLSKRLSDIGKYLTEVQYLETTSRKANLNPIFIRRVQEILSNSTPDTTLYGKDLPLRIKELKDAEKLLKDVTQKKAQSQQQSMSSNNGKSYSNRKAASNERNSN